MEIQQSILNGSFLNEGFQESLKPSTFVSDVQNIAERSRASFNDILGLTKEISTHGRAGGSHGHLCNSQHQTKFLQQAEHERFMRAIILKDANGQIICKWDGEAKHS